MIPYNALVSTKYGMMLANRNDAYVGQSLLRYGEFSDLEVEFLRQFVPPGSVVIDAGANTGALTIPFAHMVGLKGCVIAFEPQRICYQTLCANIQLNSLPNVIAFQYALGNEGDSIRIPLLDPFQPNNFGGIALSQEATGEVVPLARLDEMGLPPAGLLKIDVEGMEPEVLKGARGYITEHKPVLYVEADRQERKAELMQLLEELQYNAFVHNPPLYNPGNFRRDEHSVFMGTTPEGHTAPILSINLLCLPQGQEPPHMEGA